MVNRKQLFEHFKIYQDFKSLSIVLRLSFSYVNRKNKNLFVDSEQREEAIDSTNMCVLDSE